MKTQHYPENASNNFLKLRNQLISATGKAIGDYNMVEDGDTVLVCMSGGKDSFTMLMMLLALQERAPITFQDDCDESWIKSNQAFLSIFCLRILSSWVWITALWRLILIR